MYNITIGDRVKPHDADISSVVAYRTMEGTVVEIVNDFYVLVTWDMDKNVVGLRPSKRHVNYLKKVEYV